MEWTKIKPQHFLFTQMTMLEHGALARLLCLTAYLERVPTDREMSRHVPEATRKTLADTLRGSGSTLAGVLAKVLDDVEGVKHKRELSRETSKRYRKKHQSFPQGGDASCDTTEEIRGEKIREDNKNNTASPAFSDSLKTVFKEVYERGLNIYALINRLNNERRSTEPMPDAVIMRVCMQYLACPSAVKNQWAWFMRVLNAELDLYNANNRIADHQALKNAPVARCVAELIKTI